MPDERKSYGVEKLEKIDESLAAQGEMYEDLAEEHGAIKATYLYYKKLIFGG